eukprot:scaffold68546_cov60-Phaeocystis_antarctica.AAC.1
MEPNLFHPQPHTHLISAARGGATRGHGPGATHGGAGPTHPRVPRPCAAVTRGYSRVSVLPTFLRSFTSPPPSGGSMRLYLKLCSALKCLCPRCPA